MSDFADIEARHRRDAAGNCGCICQSWPCDARRLLYMLELQRQDAASWRKIAEGAHDECYERSARAEADAARLAEALREIELQEAPWRLVETGGIPWLLHIAIISAKAALAAHEKEQSTDGE